MGLDMEISQNNSIILNPYCPTHKKFVGDIQATECTKPNNCKSCNMEYR